MKPADKNALQPICNPEFASVMGDFDSPEIHHGPQVVYGIWQDFRLAYCNAAWFSFAAENRGEPQISADWFLGRSIFDAIPQDLKGFYREKFQSCLVSGQHWTHEYECSSDQVYRKYHQTVYPFQKHGLLVVNALVVETATRPFEGPADYAGPETYIDEHGFVHQCCHCRRVNNQQKTEQWDWVSWFVTKPNPLTTHGICPHCLNHYYPEAKKYL